MKCDACETHQEQLFEDGDGSQVLCTHLDNTMEQDEAPTNGDGVNNAVPDDSGFPDDSNTGDEDNIFTNVKPWREVPWNSWLRVLEIAACMTINGPAHIVKLQARDGEQSKAWTTSIIGNALANKDKNKCGKILFVKSLEKTQSKNNKCYFNFQTKLL